MNYSDIDVICSSKDQGLGYLFKLIRLICEGRAMDLQNQPVQSNRYAVKEIPSAAWVGSHTNP